MCVYLCKSITYTIYRTYNYITMLFYTSFTQQLEPKRLIGQIYTITIIFC